jgi:hypothetical protein
MRQAPISPLAYVGLDGQERKFLITLGALKRLRSAATTADGFETAINLVWAAQYPWSKSAISADEIADTMPADLDELTKFIEALREHSGMPKENPTEAVKEPTPEPPNSTPGPSGESSSEEQAANTTALRLVS